MRSDRARRKRRVIARTRAGLVGRGGRALERFGLQNNYSYVSTGGGASSSHGRTGASGSESAPERGPDGRGPRPAAVLVRLPSEFSLQLIFGRGRGGLNLAPPS